MKIKYSPCKWNEYANIAASPNTEIISIDENRIKIDGEIYEFDPLDVEWPDIAEQTNGVIIEAHRSDMLYLTIRRFYTQSCAEWDTGDYHEIIW